MESRVSATKCLSLAAHLDSLTSVRHDATWQAIAQTKPIVKDASKLYGSIINL